MKVLRRLYEWFLSLADKAYATWALGITAFAEAFIFPVPPDVLLLPLCLGKPHRAFVFAFICSVFSVLGACAGYLLGSFLWEGFFSYGVFTEEQFAVVGEMFGHNAFYALLVSAFTPIPFKVFTVASGFFNVGFGVLLAGSAIGRSARFFLLAVVVWRFGDDAKAFIDRYFNLLTVIAAVIFIAAIYMLAGTKT